MPKCSECAYEGPYEITRNDITVHYVSEDGVETGQMKYMRCQAPGGGPTQNPISWRESLQDFPCDFYKPKTAVERPVTAPSTHTITLEGESLDAIRAEALAQMPENMVLDAEQNAHEAESKTITVTGATVDEATAKANARVASGAAITQRSATGPKTEAVTISADDDASARQQAQSRVPSEAALGKVTLVKPGKKGFLGIGRTPGEYTADIVHPARASVTYAGKARASYTFSSATADALARVRDGVTLWERVDRFGMEPNLDVRLQKTAKEQPPGIPFFIAHDGQPIILLRLEGNLASQLPLTAQAVQQNLVLLIPHMAKYPQAPVINHGVILYDDPNEPFKTEGFSPVFAPDVQIFALALLRSRGNGEIRLFNGAVAEPVAAGRFRLYTGTLPMQAGTLSRSIYQQYQPTVKDLVSYGTLIRDAATHLASIPAGQRNFKAAVQRYTQEY